MRYSFFNFLNSVLLVLAFVSVSTYGLTDLRAESGQGSKSLIAGEKIEKVEKKTEKSDNSKSSFESSKSDDAVFKSFRKWQKMMVQSEGQKKMDMGKDSQSMMKSMEKSDSMGMSQGSAKDGENVEVIGSRIKRTDIEGAIPITILNREHLELSGKTSLGDLLRGEVSIPFGVHPAFTIGNNISQFFGDAGIRGQKTLVLLNGRKIVTKPGESSVDLSTIPISAIERVEFLKESSSIYGSDSIGGVINVVTRKDLGFGIYASHKQPFETGGLSPEVNLIAGYSDKNYSVSSVIQYTYEDVIHSEDRDFYHPGYSGFGNPGTIHYTYEAGGKKVTYSVPSSDCPPHLMDSNKVCKYEYSEVMEQHPEMHKFGGLINFEIDLDLFKISTGAIAQRRMSTYYLAANPVPLAYLGLSQETVDRMVDKFTWKTDNSRGQLASVSAFNYRFTDAGPRKIDQEADSINTWLVVEGSMFLDWDWKASLGYGYSRDDSDLSDFAELNKLIIAMEGGLYNPFPQTNEEKEENKKNLKEFMVNPFAYQKAHLATFDAFVSGKAVDLPYGPLNVSLGGEINFQKYKQTVDKASEDKSIIGHSAFYGEDERTIYSLFAEGNTIIIPNLETAVSARFDNYSDFGNTFNPRAHLRYQVLPSILFRGNVGTSFVAPDLARLFNGGHDYTYFADDTDREDGDFYKSTLEYLTIIKPNPDLEKEKDFTFSFGTVFEVSEGSFQFYFGSDFWAFWRKDVIGVYGAKDVLKAEGGKNGSEEQRKKVEGLGQKVVRSDDNHRNIEQVELKAQNIYDEDIYGLDLFLGGSLPAFFGYKINLGFDFAYIFKDVYEAFPGLGRKNHIGTVKSFAVYHNPLPRWKGEIKFSVRKEKLGFQTKIRSISGFKGVGKKYIPIYYDVDLAGEYSFSAKHKVVLGINNLIYDYPEEKYEEFKREDSSIAKGVSQVFYKKIYDPRGRYAYVTYKYML